MGGVDEIGWVGHLDLRDRGREVAFVVGDEPVRTHSHRGGQMGGVYGLEPVPVGQGRREFGGGPVDRTQVQPGQQGGEDADLVGGAIAQRPAEDLRD